MKRTNPGSEPLIEWRATPPRALPPTAGLHLWRIRTDARGADLAEAAGLLDAPQRARAEHLRHAPMRERYIRAQSGLRRVLGHYFGIDPRLIRFTHGPAGKPDLPPELGVCSFNLTTTGDLALVEAETMRPLAARREQGPMRLIAAARLGTVRLLDNIAV